MATSAILLVLLSATLHVGWNSLVKSSRDPRAFSAAKGVPLVLAGAFTVWLQPMGAIPPDLWLWIAISGVIHAFYVLALSNAYALGDISFVYPVVRSAPAFVPIAAFGLLGETVSAQGGLGIAIVVGCIALLHVGGWERAGLSRLRGLPILAAPGSRWALLTLASVVAYTLVDKAGMLAFRRVQEIPEFQRGVTYLTLETSICYLIYWLHESIRGAPGLVGVVRTEWPRILLAAIGGLVSYSLILHVYQTEKVSYVVALRQSSVVLAVLIGWLWLDEERSPIRAVAAVAMVAGFALVATAR